MPRWPDNLVDSVFYLYENEEDALNARNEGACGFLLSVPWDHPGASSGSRHIYAVSNYHATVRGGASIIRLNKKGAGSGLIPTDPCEWLWQTGSDLAVYRLNGSIHFQDDTIWQYSHVAFSEVNCTDEIIRDFQIGPGDDVFSVGRFTDIYGIQQNTPLMRSGIVASRGPVSIRTGDSIPWQEETCWVVEMRSRTGFSGSPIYIYIAPWQPKFIDAPARKYGNFFFGPWLLGVHSASIPGHRDERSAGSGMAAVVPCRALESLLMQNNKVRDERAAYEQRFLSVQTAAPGSPTPLGG